ncbi:MAG: serine hydrolase [Verrucomicrobia bacterium]|nr:serine hydrolase [Verrucomicrobiota bacterium]
MRLLRSLPLLLSFGLVAASPVSVAIVQGQTPAPVAAASEAIDRARALVKKDFAPKVPGLSVAVAVDGRLVWAEGFGYADLAQKSPVTPATRFRIGSISKSLSSVGLALLVERGQLDLDAPVQHYVPDFPDKGAVITTRLLGGHLAGIRHYRGNEILLNRPFPNVRAGLTIFENDPLVTPPGKEYHYSTYGWSVLSAVMESAAHEEFLAFMQTQVIGPLGLTHTRPDRAGVADPERTQFYEGDPPGGFKLTPTVDSSYKWAAGGYLSTPEDLVRFGSALLQPGFLKAESLALLFTPQKTSDGKPTTYGIGWVIGRDAHGHRLYLHTGGSVGGTSILILHPETRTVVALVCNHSKSPFAKASWDALVELFAPSAP